MFSSSAPSRTYFATRSSGTAAMASSPLLLWLCVLFCSCYCLVALGGRERLRCRPSNLVLSVPTSMLICIPW